MKLLIYFYSEGNVISNISKYKSMSVLYSVELVGLTGWYSPSLLKGFNHYVFMMVLDIIICLTDSMER